MERYLHVPKHFIKNHPLISGVLGVLAVLLAGAIVFSLSKNYGYMPEPRSFQASAPVTKVLAFRDEQAEGSWLEAGESQYDFSQERKLVRSGSLSMVVEDIGDSRRRIESLVEQSGGFIAHQYFSDYQYYDGYEQPSSQGVSGHLTLRVPGASFDEFMKEMRAIALVVNNESSTVEDVTEAYTDLKIRLQNKQREEEQYRTILRQAQEISDILEVSKYLAQARGEVEQLQGQVNVLSNQVNLATIEVHLESEQTVVVGRIAWNPGAAVKDGWNTLLAEVVAFVNRLITVFFALPIILLYLFVYGGGLYLLMRLCRLVYRRLYK